MFVGNRLAVRNARRGKHPNGRVCSHWRQRNPHICTVLLKGTHLGSAAVRHRLVVTAAPNVQDYTEEESCGRTGGLRIHVCNSAVYKLTYCAHVVKRVRTNTQELDIRSRQAGRQAGIKAGSHTEAQHEFATLATAQYVLLLICQLSYKFCMTNISLLM